MVGCDSDEESLVLEIVFVGIAWADLVEKNGVVASQGYSSLNKDNITIFWIEG